MLDRDKIEKSLLLGIVRDKNWEVLLLNNVVKECFSFANYDLYDYIKSAVDSGTYPEMSVLLNLFEIENEYARECLMVQNLDEVCNILHDEYVRNQLKYKIGKLNDFKDEVNKNPVQYVDRLNDVVNDVRKISYHTKSVNLLDKIEDILTIDKSNVIGTGFKELDDKLIGFQKGEELVVLAGRTGNR